MTSKIPERICRKCGERAYPTKSKLHLHQPGQEELQILFECRCKGYRMSYVWKIEELFGPKDPGAEAPAPLLPTSE